MAKFTHSVMPHSLAKALIEAGVHHFDIGGAMPATSTTTSTARPNQGSMIPLPAGTNPMGSSLNPMTSAQNGIGSVGNGVAAAGGVTQGVAGDFTAQNGYQANLAPTDYTNFGGYINAAGNNSLNGYTQAEGIQVQQQALANTLLAQSQGAGPNPAQTALATETGQNAQTQGALMASQRGAAANPALIARQAAQTGAQTQQTAVGQAATLQAQQELAAEQALQQQQATIGGQNIQEQGVNNQLLATTAGAQNTQNSNDIQNYNMAQGINSQVAQNNTNAVNKNTSALTGGLGSSITSMFAKGGKVTLPPHLHKMAEIYHPHKYADGGGVGDSASITVPNLNNSAALASSSSSGGGSSGGDSGGGLGGLASMAMLAMKQGGGVPGKAKVKGNSEENDTVPALLSPGEDVLPRSVTMARNAPDKAADFVRALQEQEGKKDEGSSYHKIAAGKRSLKDRVARLEKMCMGGAA